MYFTYSTKSCETVCDHKSSFPEGSFARCLFAMIIVGMFEVWSWVGFEKLKS